MGGNTWCRHYYIISSQPLNSIPPLCCVNQSTHRISAADCTFGCNFKYTSFIGKCIPVCVQSVSLLEGVHYLTVSLLERCQFCEICGVRGIWPEAQRTEVANRSKRKSILIRQLWWWLEDGLAGDPPKNICKREHSLWGAFYYHFIVNRFGS